MKKDENLGSWILIIDNWCYFSNKPSANIWTEMPENYMSLNIHKTKTWKWIDKSSVWPVFSPFDLSIALGLPCLQNERWLWYSWLCSSRLSSYCLAYHFNSSGPSLLNGVKCITKWDSKYSISCYMLISEGLNMQTYWTTANYKSIRFIVIYCVLISTNVQFSDQNALHDSSQVLPCNRFFFSLRDLTVLHPKTFDSQSFIRPISLSVGKGQRPGFSEGLFIGSEQQTGCK